MTKLEPAHHASESIERFPIRPYETPSRFPHPDARVFTRADQHETRFNESRSIAAQQPRLSRSKLSLTGSDLVRRLRSLQGMP